MRISVNTNVLWGVNRLTSSGFDPDAVAIFNRMPNPLEAYEEIAINNFVVSSKQSGNFSKYDYMFFHALTDPDNALTDWFTGVTATAVNAPTHIPKEGYNFNGSTQYILTNIDLSINSTNYLLNTADIINYLYSNSNAVWYSFGARDASGPITITGLSRNAPDMFYLLNESNFDISPALFTFPNRYYLQRRSTDKKLFRGGAQVRSLSGDATQRIPSANLTIGCRSDLSLFFNGKISYWGNGGGFDQTSLNLELNELENALIV